MLRVLKNGLPRFPQDGQTGNWTFAGLQNKTRLKRLTT